MDSLNAGAFWPSAFMRIKQFKKISRNVIQDFHETRGGQYRLQKRTLRSAHRAFRSILANVLKRPPESWVFLPRAKEEFGPDSHYRLVGRHNETFIQVLDYLVKHGYLEQRRGGHNRETKQGYRTRIRATDKLHEAMRDVDIEKVEVWEPFLPLDRVTVRATGEKRRRYLKVPEVEYVYKIRAELAVINQTADKLEVTLPINWIEEIYLKARLCSREKKKHHKRKGRQLTQEEKQKLKEWLNNPLKWSLKEAQNIFNRELHLTKRKRYARKFVDDLNHGGRLYGPAYQQLPSEFRAQLLLNGKATVELDFDSLHPNMLYHLEGLECPGDAYELPELSEEENVVFRKMTKRTVQKLINAVGKMEHTALKDLPKPFCNNNAYYEAILNKHKPIKHRMASGAGKWLQKIDGDIAQAILLEAAKRGINVLAIHDSFIVNEDKAEVMKELMQQTYHEFMGKDIVVTQKERKPIKVSEEFKSQLYTLLLGEDWSVVDPRFVIPPIDCVDKACGLSKSAHIFREVFGDLRNHKDALEEANTWWSQALVAEKGSQLVH